jgi:hypothetical protein
MPCIMGWSPKAWEQAASDCQSHDLFMHLGSSVVFYSFCLFVYTKHKNASHDRVGDFGGSAGLE